MNELLRKNLQVAVAFLWGFGPVYAHETGHHQLSLVPVGGHQSGYAAVFQVTSFHGDLWGQLLEGKLPASTGDLQFGLVSTDDGELLWGGRAHREDSVFLRCDEQQCDPAPGSRVQLSFKTQKTSQGVALQGTLNGKSFRYFHGADIRELQGVYNLKRVPSEPQTERFEGEALVGGYRYSLRIQNEGDLAELAELDLPALIWAIWISPFEIR
jgi:hypothetical protein